MDTTFGERQTHRYISRETGPSNQDERFAQANGLPGIVYDFGQPHIYCGIAPYSSKSARFFWPIQKEV